MSKCHCVTMVQPNIWKIFYRSSVQKILNIQNTWINSVHFRIDYWFCMTYEIWRVHSRFFSRDFPSFNKSRINRKIVWYLRTNVLGCINGLAAENHTVYPWAYYGNYIMCIGIFSMSSKWFRYWFEFMRIAHDLNFYL